MHFNNYISLFIVINCARVGTRRPRQVTSEESELTSATVWFFLALVNVASPIFPSVLPLSFSVPAGEALAAGSVYSVPLVNALVLYLGASVIQQMQTSAQLGAGASPRAASRSHPLSSPTGWVSGLGGRCRCCRGGASPGGTDAPRLS